MRRLILLAAVLALVPLVAHAQPAPGLPGAMLDPVGQITARFGAATRAWEGPLQALALGTFAILASIDIALMLIRQALRGGASLSDYIEALIHETLYLGAFGWLVSAYTTWNPVIIRSFRYAAGQAGGAQSLSPGEILYSGVDIFQRIVSKVTILDPGPSMVISLVGIVVLIIFALICAEIVVALGQAFFISSAGVIFMCAGGSRFSRDLAMSVIRATIGIGARLFSLQLIVAIGMTFVGQWVAEFHDVNIQGAGVILASSLVLLVTARQIPSMVERMCGGVGFASGGAVFDAAKSVAGHTMAAGRVAGAAGAALQDSGARWQAGFGAASENMAQRVAAGTAPTSAAMRMAQMVGGAAAHAMRGNANNNIGSRLGGRRGGI